MLTELLGDFQGTLSMTRSKHTKILYIYIHNEIWLDPDFCSPLILAGGWFALGQRSWFGAVETIGRQLYHQVQRGHRLSSLRFNKVS